VCDWAADQPAGLETITPGAPIAGVAESFLDLPVGVPLSGYTSRCKCFGDDGDVDLRDSAYTAEFNPSAGVQTRVPVKVTWIGNGQEDLVLVRTDVIYSFDGLVEEVERRLSAASGKDLDGKVVIATNHSHSSYGDFSDQVTYYLGSDRFNYEIFLRMAGTIEDTAMAAHDSMQPVKIGLGIAKDWDDGRVYHDRRGDNDQVQFFPDIPAGSYKDPTLTVIRIDTMDDSPLALLFDFGMHGTSLDGDNAMISTDAPGGVELVLQDQFDAPVMVQYFQGAGGDASPGGSDDWFARLESIGEYAADPIMELWSQTPTSADAIRLEVASRSIAETGADIRVTRDGTVDWYYLPYDENYVPDDRVYEDEVRDADGNLVSGGAILSPLDEFNSAYGEAFCGENPPYLPGYAPAAVFPYEQCVDLELMLNIIRGFFDLTDEEAALPLAESTRAAVTAARIGPLPIRDPDGTTTTDDVLLATFPGEITAWYTEHFRRRAAAELGMKHSLAIGYAQDHEGYLLVPEDWLLGGYEADINVWGPLQGEHIMEGLLTMAAEQLSTDAIEQQDPCGQYQPPDYGDNELPTRVPDQAPEAGTLLATSPAYLYSPLLGLDEMEDGAVPDLAIPAEVPRVQGIVQVAWIGGDPGVDFPLVTLERRGGDGSWSPVLTAAGRTITGGPDILVAHTPDPQYPPEATQTHRWWAAWQAVGHVHERAGVPAGVYRLHVAGNTFDGGATTWPWPASPYELTSAEFEVVPAEISVAVAGSSVTASLRGPPRGYRLVGLGGNLRGDNPLPSAEATLRFHFPEGALDESSATGTEGGGVTTFADVVQDGCDWVEVEDIYGNVGRASCP
jgi:neutral ceramidase